MLRRAIVPAGLALGGQILWGITPYHLPASAISFGIRITLLWSLIASMLLFPDERKLLKRPVFYLGLALLIGGFAWFYYTRSTDNPLSADQITVTGVLVLLACSLFFGLYGVSVRYFLRDVEPLLGFGVVCQFVAAGTLIGMLFLMILSLP